MRPRRPTPIFLGIRFLYLIAVRTTLALSWNGIDSDIQWAPDCDFLGRDFKNELTSGNLCGPFCKANPQCSHFTWTNYQGGTCWMKEGFVTAFDVVSKTNEDAVCGFLKSHNGHPSRDNWKDEGNYIWAPTCDFFNKDFTSVVATTFDYSGPACLADPTCSHFIWTDYEGGCCWLKTGVASECDALVKTVSNAACGFMKY